MYEALGSRKWGKCCGCIAKVHVLIRGDLPIGAIKWRYGSQPVTCRMGPPAEQVPAAPGTHPPDAEKRNKGGEQDGSPWWDEKALHEETPEVRGQKSAKVIVAQRLS